MSLGERARRRPRGRPRRRSAGRPPARRGRRRGCVGDQRAVGLDVAGDVGERAARGRRSASRASSALDDVERVAGTRRPGRACSRRRSTARRGRAGGRRRSAGAARAGAGRRATARGRASRSPASRRASVSTVTPGTRSRSAYELAGLAGAHARGARSAQRRSGSSGTPLSSATSIVAVAGPASARVQLPVRGCIQTSQPARSAIGGAWPQWSMWAWVMTTSRTSLERGRPCGRARARGAPSSRGRACPVSTSTIPSPACSAHALQCGTPGRSSGSRSRQTPGSTRSPRPTSRGRVGLRTGGTLPSRRWRRGPGAAKRDPQGARDRVPRRGRLRARAARLADARHPRCSTPRSRAATSSPAEDAWQRARRVPVRAARRALGDRRDAEPIDKQKELLARFRFASPDERRWIREVLREHLAEHFPDDGGTVNVDALRPLLTDYCLEVQPGQQVLVRVARRSPRRCCWRCSARSSSARRGRCCAPRCPARTRASGAPRATPTSTASRPPSSPRRERSTPRCGIQAPENANALAGVDPARHGARRARPRAAARGRARAPLGDHAVADRRRRPAGRDGHARVRGLRRAARCSWTATTPSPPGASCARSRRG